MFRLKCGLAVVLCLMVCSLPAYATLINRGNGLIYDSVLDITWLQDAGVGPVTTWSGAKTWAQNLTYDGYSDWRLPSMSVSGRTTSVDCGSSSVSETDCEDNELGYMYYYNLTPAGRTSPTGSGTNLTGDQGLIQNIGWFYWSRTEAAPNTHSAWIFDFNGGGQLPDGNDRINTAWAVRPGDVVAAVPEPPALAIALFSLGLIGLGVAIRRVRANR